MFSNKRKGDITVPWGAQVLVNTVLEGSEPDLVHGGRLVKKYRGPRV